MTAKICKKMKLSILFVLIFSSIAVISQETKITVYEPFKTDQKIDPSKDIKVEENCFKWNFSMLTRGGFVINYERLLKEQLSFEFGCGLTYRDYIFEMFKQGDMYYSIYNSDENNSITAKLGYALEMSLRYYPKDGNLEGFYVAPVFRYRSYSMELEKEVNSELQKYPSGYKMSEFGFVIGAQSEWTWSGILWDYYFGVSYRMDRYHSFEEEYDINNHLIDLDNRIIQWNHPAILLGLKIGFTM